MKEDGDTVIVGNFEVALTLTTNRTIKMSGYVYNKDTPEEINHRLDQFQDAIERQAVRCDVTNKEAQIDAMMAQLEGHADHFSSIVEKKNSGQKLTSQDKALIDKYDMDVRGAKKSIESLQAAVKKGKSRLNGAAAQ